MENEALGYFLTLCGAVVLISRNPREPHAPLCLVGHLQVSWWVRSLCQHDSKEARKQVQELKKKYLQL